MPYYPGDDFKKLAEEIKLSGNSHSLTVRKLLRLFHQERRSHRVIPWIRQNLAKAGLDCEPDFEHVFIDSTVQLRKKPTVKAHAKNPIDTSAVSARDPVPRLALLPAANQIPISVARDADLQRAITLMMMHDYSQLPVMQGERSVDGLISLRSIVSARSVGVDCKTVRECLIKDVQVLAHDTPLFEAVKTVMRSEVVLVKGPDQKIVGLVTIADIGEQFVSLAEPFLILEQIENHIRALLDSKFTIDQLKEASDDEDSEREIESISDLTFGEYVRLLEKPDNWKILNLQMDRATFTKRLDQVRRIRNEVMHFHPDGISSEDLNTLRETAKFFYAFSQFRK